MPIPGGDEIQGSLEMDDSCYLISSCFCGWNINPFLLPIPEISYQVTMLSNSCYVGLFICFVGIKKIYFKSGLGQKCQCKIVDQGAIKNDLYLFSHAFLSFLRI